MRAGHGRCNPARQRRSWTSSPVAQALWSCSTKPSIAPLDDLRGPHVALLGAGVVVVEGLDLTRAPAGEYTLVCLPLPIAGGDGAPARVVLIAP